MRRVGRPASAFPGALDVLRRRPLRLQHFPFDSHISRGREVVHGVIIEGVFDCTVLEGIRENKRVPCASSSLRGGSLTEMLLFRQLKEKEEAHSRFYKRQRGAPPYLSMRMFSLTPDRPKYKVHLTLGSSPSPRLLLLPVQRADLRCSVPLSRPPRPLLVQVQR